MDIADRIVRKSDWHETRETYSPTYIDYDRLRALIDAAILAERSASDKRVEEALERAARLADKAGDFPAGRNVARTVAAAIRGLKSPANPEKE